MKMLEVVTTLTGQVFDVYVKPATPEKTNSKTGEVYQAQPEKFYLQFMENRVVNKETGETKKNIVDCRIFDDPKKYIDKVVQIQVNVYNVGGNTYYSQVEDTEIKIVNK